MIEDDFSLWTDNDGLEASRFGIMKPIDRSLNLIKCYIWRLQFDECLMLLVWLIHKVIKHTKSYIKWFLSCYCATNNKSYFSGQANIFIGAGFIWVNTVRPRQNGRHFTHDTFKCIILNENVSIAIKILLKFVPKSPINNIPVLVQIMAWRRPGDKPLSEIMMVSLSTYICVTRPQWVHIIAGFPPTSCDPIWSISSTSRLLNGLAYFLYTFGLWSI